MKSRQPQSSTPQPADSSPPQQELSPALTPAAARMVTFRAVFIALLLMPVNAYWVIQMEVTRYSGHPTTISLFFNVVFILAVLIGLNSLVGMVLPRARLAPGELLTVYIMLALASAVAGHDMIEVLLPILSHAHYFAGPENGWESKILPFLPAWLTVSDKEALKEFYQGASTLYNVQNLRAWLAPALWWSGFFTVLGFIMLCLNTILRRQWTESEKLPFPLVSLPLEMVNPKTQLFKSRLFWLGVSLAAALELWNGLAYLYPSLPFLPLKPLSSEYYLSTHLTTPPWNAVEGLAIALYPFGIALGMLLPVDLLFSAWFFTWVWQGERVIGSVYGFGRIPGYPYVEPQSFGAYIGLALFALWNSRSHFVHLWRNLFEKGVDLGDANEPLPYRWAVAGLLAGCAAIFAFCYQAGMTPMMIGAFFVIYFLLAVAITRIRAELGPPAHDLHVAGPDSIIPTVMQPGQVGQSNLAMFSLFYGFNRAYRSHPMPIQLEGFKIAERVGAGRYRPLFFAMLLSIAFGALCAFWADLHQSYQVGAANISPPNVQLIFGSEPWNRMASWTATYTAPQTIVNTRIAIGVGFAVSLLLNTLRLRLAWFPFHPVGYAVSSSWSLGLLWLPLFIAWVIKLCILRYGGLRAYRASLPFFLGVILGECILGSFWTIIGIVRGIPTYAFWP